MVQSRSVAWTNSRTGQCGIVYKRINLSNKLHPEGGALLISHSLAFKVQIESKTDFGLKEYNEGSHFGKAS